MKNVKILASVASVSIAGGLPLTAHAQITYQTLQFQNSPSTGVTGMRGDNITGSYSFPGGTAGCSIASRPARSSRCPRPRPTAPTSRAR